MQYARLCAFAPVTSSLVTWPRDKSQDLSNVALSVPPIAAVRPPIHRTASSRAVTVKERQRLLRTPASSYLAQPFPLGWSELYDAAAARNKVNHDNDKSYNQQ
jgi:hypothetical protein